MTARLILGAFLTPSRRARLCAPLLNASRRSAARSNARNSACNNAHHSPQRRGQESGYAFIFVLGLMLVMIAVSLTALQLGATIRRRRIEQETIWRGNQYTRAIRLYYHKTGHYPQTLDDLVKGMPNLHFLRQAYKNPTNSGDGSWRFIYVNANGQIIGSTKYANLQQMALMDANGGQLPTLQGQPGQPGQPGVPVSTLANASSGGAYSQPPQNTAPVANDNSTGSTPPGYTPPDSTQPGSTPNGSTDASGNPSSNPQNSQPPNGDNSQSPQSSAQNSQNSQNPGANSASLNNLGSGQNNLQSLAALGQAGLAVNPAMLAAMALLKPSGPVDGPVLGGFLTGVGCTKDSASQKVYHGGKKYIDWEFIWTPLEDAAAAMQQQLGGAQGGGLGLGQSTTTSPFGAAPGSATPGQQNPTSSNPIQQQPQQPQQPQQSQPQQ